MTKKSTIKKYDGKDVTRQAMSLRKTGDGLSQALAIDPLSVHIGDEITLVVRGEVASVQYKQDQKGTSDLTEVIIVNGGTITVADDIEVIDALLAAQAEKNTLAKEKAEGIQRIPGTPGADEGEPEDGDE